MLIGKPHIFMLFIGALLSGCSGSKNNVSVQPPEEAWWVSKQFTALEDNIHETPLVDINKDWKLVSILSTKYLEAHLSEAQYTNIQNSPLSPSVEANLDGLPGMETLFVGVFESYSGATGRFIAIKQDRKIIKYFTHSGMAGYSSVYLDGDKLRWYKCMECNDFDVILWSQGKYVLQ